ncbi:hypothetical protein HYH02_003643 [Chlamydomonas schloesseri]|uniref:Flagellar associated protein n=1 Tax=Chlamydomonas schloesseri TaxID=2026947 RepID=A0A836B9K9_9CHLO|nr:hypothetical protein HYH02_003643 [Chlamydomonas schloesseri]|eukprot:KAG2451867.1 hypothetical protein HYH02_003643 [Chlamydomonas schloesseri]
MTEFGATFRKDLFSKEVAGWLGRATPADRERFERVFESIRSVTETKQSPDAHADFINSTLDKMRRRGSSAATGPSGKRPPLAPGGATVVAQGWSYTATRAAMSRPETQSTLASLADRVAEEQATAAAAAERERANEHRPHSAPNNNNNNGTAAAPSTASAVRDRELSSFDRAAARRRAISFGAPSIASGSADATAGSVTDNNAVAAAVAAYQQQQQRAAQVAMAAGPAGGATGVAGVSPDGSGTTYAESYNLRSMYPEVYDQALRETKADPVPNYTLISEWGDSLKAGVSDAHKLYMCTTYNRTNDEVCKLETTTDQVREQEFFKWMQRQKTYYGDLLARAPGQDLESVLSVADDEQKRDILNALRQLHAVVDPDQIKSHSQAVHCDMRGIQNLDLEAKLKEFTKRKTMGGPHTELAIRKPGAAKPQRPATAELRPNTVDLTFGASAPGPGAGGEPSSSALKPSKPRPATAGAALGNRGTGGANVPAPRRAFATAGQEKKDTFLSKVPLQWSVGATGGPLQSAYTDTFGGRGAGRVRPNSALLRTAPVKYHCPTCPIGAVNPHTAMAPMRSAYPVPESFLGATMAGGTGSIAFPQHAGQTVYRSEYAPRDAAAVTATLAAQAALTEQAGKQLQKSTLPMGPKNGINLVGPVDWCSEMKDEYVPHATNYVTSNADTRVSMRVMFNGPTASVGKVATLVDSTGRLVKY